MPREIKGMLVMLLGFALIGLSNANDSLVFNSIGWLGGAVSAAGAVYATQLHNILMHIFGIKRKGKSNE